MTELEEILENKTTIENLEKELAYQLEMGESLGGTICSQITWRISCLKAE